MNPKHCVSLDIAKQLREAGWMKETEFCFCDVADKRFGREKNEQFRLYDKDTAGNRRHSIGEKDIQCFAPLATELLEELPREISINQYPEGDSFRYQVGHNVNKMALQTFKYNNNLCDGLAEMWLYFKEKGLLK